MNLYLALLRVQARLMGGTLVGIALAILVAFATPWLLDFVPGQAESAASPAQLFLRRGPVAGGVLLITSILLGGMAGHQWADEGSRNKGVYLMMLPLERWHLLLLEFAVAVTFIAGGALLTGIAGAATAAVAPIPEGLHAYPVALATRFFASSLLIMSLVFGPSRSVAQADPAQRRFTLLGIAFVIIVLIGVEASGFHVVSRTVTALFSPGGPLQLISGSWMLVDL